MNILTKSLGEIILGIGKLSEKEHLINLGHYMSCRGGKRELDSKFNKLIQLIFEDIDHLENYFGETINIKKMKWRNPSKFYLWGKDEKKFMKLRNELYNTVGKFQIKKVKNTLVILDHYDFYPWCGNESHGKNCSCTSRDWAKIPIKIRKKVRSSIKCRALIRFYSNQKRIYMSFLGKEVMRIKKPRTFFDLEIIISNCGISFELEIYDHVFEGLGKPFYTIKRIILEE